MPVVSVGNLTLGGTGKTPCVEYVARFYRDLGVQVAILSRGYGAEGGRNDEAMVLEENLPDVPHLQGADRVGAGDARGRGTGERSARARRRLPAPPARTATSTSC